MCVEASEEYNNITVAYISHRTYFVLLQNPFEQQNCQISCIWRGCIEVDGKSKYALHLCSRVNEQGATQT